MTKDKDGKKEEYVVYYYYYYDDDRKNDTAKEQPVDSLDSFDNVDKTPSTRFQPKTVPSSASLSQFSGATTSSTATPSLKVNSQESVVTATASSTRKLIRSLYDMYKSLLKYTLSLLISNTS